MINKIRVLITGVDVGSVGLQVAKSLKLENSKYILYGTNIKDTYVGRRNVDFFRTVPSANSPEYLDHILEYCVENQIKLIYPGSEIELSKLAKSVQLFAENQIYLVAQPYELIKLCLDKFSLFQKLDDYGIEIPTTSILNEQFLVKKNKKFPMVLKPLSGSGSKNVFLVQSERELELHFEIANLNNIKLLAQEYISENDGEFTVSVLSDPKTGDIRNTIIIRREIHSGISNKIVTLNQNLENLHESHLYISSGITQGEFVEDNAVSNFSEKIALLLGSKGALNFQCRKQNNKVFLFEINPRFSGTTYARALAGFNEPHLLGQSIINDLPIPCAKALKASYLIREINDFVI